MSHLFETKKYLFIFLTTVTAIRLFMLTSRHKTEVPPTKNPKSNHTLVKPAQTPQWTSYNNYYLYTDQTLPTGASS